MIFQEQSSPIIADELIEAFMKALVKYPDHKEYIEEDRLVDLGKKLSPEDGEKAFKEIEFELLGFNLRANVVLPKPRM
ncbi:MAG: hypothetical protein ABI370_08515 [Gammaproteobacteria bacterium]